jgi:hypothetical protein
MHQNDLVPRNSLCESVIERRYRREFCTLYDRRRFVIESCHEHVGFNRPPNRIQRGGK